MLVQDFLQNSAERLPEKVALVCGGQRVTYAALDAMANRLANALLAHGVACGDRVVVHLENSIEAVASIFATLKAGAVCVPVNPRTRPVKLACILNDCQAAALVTGARTDVGGLLAEAPSLRAAVVVSREAEGVGHPSNRCVTFADLQKAFSPMRPPQRGIDHDLACLVYTSGSTGQPKGVMCDHSNVVFAARSIMEYLGSREDDVVMGVLPLSFGYGLYQAFMTLGCGGTLVLEQAFTYTAEVLRRIEEQKVTGLPGVPSLFALLLQMDLSSYDLRSLRYITSAAAALPVRHIQELRARLPWAALYSMYGLTETKRALYLPPDQIERRPGSVGIAIPGTEVWIEDRDGNRVGPGEIGELIVRGPHVMRGYWNAPQETARRFRPGPLPGERVCHTGDLFRMDSGGYMYFVGRTDDLINSRGYKVAPKEVENVLYGLAGVIEATVVPVPDPVLGQAIKAVVAVDGYPITQAEVLEHCREHLEHYMVPQYVEFRYELPKTASGQIDRRELTASLS